MHVRASLPVFFANPECNITLIPVVNNLKATFVAAME